MQKTITVKGHYRKVPGRARRVRMPSFTKTITIKEPSESKEEPAVEEPTVMITARPIPAGMISKDPEPEPVNISKQLAQFEIREPSPKPEPKKKQRTPEELHRLLFHNN